MENNIEKIRTLEKRIQALELRKHSLKSIENTDIEAHIEKLKQRIIKLEMNN